MEFKFVFLICIFLSVSYANAKCTDNSRVEYSFLNGVLTEEADVLGSETAIFNILNNDNNFVKVQVPFQKDLCISHLYNKTNKVIDLIETFGQKFKENSFSFNVPFSWKLVSRLLFKVDSLQQFGIQPPLIVSMYVDSMRSIDFASESEQQTLNLITTQARGSLSQRSLVVISHSQGNLFANLLYERLNVLMPDRMKYYGNLQVGSAAKEILAPNSELITSTSDLVIAGLRAVRPTLGANVSFDLLSYVFRDPTGHFFLETYIHPSTMTPNMSASELFLRKLSNVASRVVDHKCSFGEKTYPVGSEDGSSWGYRSEHAIFIGEVYLSDKATVCGHSVVDASVVGKIVISGDKTRIDRSTLTIVGGTTSTMSLHNVEGHDFTLEESGSENADPDNKIMSVRDTSIFNTTIRDSIITNGSWISGTLDPITGIGSLSVENSQINNSTIGGIVRKSSVTDSVVAFGEVIGSTLTDNSMIQGDKIVESTLTKTTAYNSSLTKVTANNCLFNIKNLSNVTCNNDVID